MINRCYECAHSVEEQKNFHVCQIRKTIEYSPITFYDGCPFFEPKINLDFELTKLDLKNIIKNE
jgi:hypothetical protein